MASRSPLPEALDIARSMQQEFDELVGPPPEGGRSRSDAVLLRSVTKGSRTYIERIVEQINGCYEHGWYDACAVMIRRLLETLIIEAFEAEQQSALIKTNSGDFMYLSGLINQTLSYTGWNLSRNTKQALPRLKDVGDKSAHSRMFLAHKGDIDGLRSDIRIVVQELVIRAHLK